MPPGVEVAVSFEAAGVRHDLFRELVAEKPPADTPPRWRDIRLSLAELAGHGGELVLGARTIDGGNPHPLRFLHWDNPRLTGMPHRSGLNLILISIDTLRADRLGCYGYERDTRVYLSHLSAQINLADLGLGVSARVLLSS